MKQNVKTILTAMVLTVFLLQIVMAAPDPMGATLTPGNSSRGTNPAATQVSAQAGNVSQLNIDQTRITDIWQGFFGNVSGQIVLEDSGGHNFYDWTSTTTTGEVYASRNTVSSWATINCTNSTQWQTEETALHIPAAATDGINETYSSTAHTAFDVGTRTMSGCRSTRPYNNLGVAGAFWNVMLNSDGTNVVYTSLIADNQDAFDGSKVDFEVLVPTDKSTGTAQYYFYVELN
jgi:hypothetical protein